MSRVLATDHPAPTVAIEQEQLARIGAELVLAPTGDEEELLELAQTADAILTCFKQVTREVIRAASRVRVIGRYGVGVDNIAVDEATARGIPVTNVPAYCIDEVAEHALALLLALARKIVVYDAAVRRGDWELATGLPIHRVAGTTLGVVGFGRIGRAVAARAKGLGMRVCVHDHAVNSDAVVAAGVESCELDELLARSDAVTLHVPLTDATRHLIDADRIRRMKRGAFLVNASRGAVVDVDALVAALGDGHLAGAGLDVFEPEPLPPDHPIFGAPGFVATPHVAFYSEESIADLQRQATENVVAILEGRRPAWVVNPEVLDLPRWANLAPP